MLETIYVPIVYNTDSEAVKQFRLKTVAELEKLGWVSNIDMKISPLSRKQETVVRVMYKGLNKA